MKGGRPGRKPPPDPVLDRSLQQLAPEAFKPPEQPCALDRPLAELLCVTLRELTDEQLRLVLGRKAALEHLVPLTLSRLEQAPLSRAGLHQGALLLALLGADPFLWRGQPELRERLAAILRCVLSDFPREQVPAPVVKQAQEALWRLEDVRR
jgi:hypothetical protein